MGHQVEPLPLLLQPGEGYHLHLGTMDVQEMFLLLLLHQGIHLPDHLNHQYHHQVGPLHHQIDRCRQCQMYHPLPHPQLALDLKIIAHHLFMVIFHRHKHHLHHQVEERRHRLYQIIIMLVSNAINKSVYKKFQQELIEK